MAGSKTPINVGCDYCGKPIDENIDEYHTEVRTRHLHLAPNGAFAVLYNLHGQCYEQVVAPVLAEVLAAQPAGE